MNLKFGIPDFTKSFKTFQYTYVPPKWDLIKTGHSVKHDIYLYGPTESELTIACLIDFKEAFDSVHPGKLVYRLNKHLHWIDGNIVRHTQKTAINGIESGLHILSLASLRGQTFTVGLHCLCQ